ncbi:hypothetical protein CcCBS67573_g08108 [Chytriomyces confervae]|uniref:Homeobox domain-containing protein n=1 Tax=Chytriomyces confervae TaxID=246404 RepID=A0A507ENV1_9FUNG|nr:hypothetical protein HDU80_010429 [Chytriomyces hyalinus]TPX65511.1 hypothetical protein CcCBS67573_g08108 [Chytriomyces confervae]
MQPGEILGGIAGNNAYPPAGAIGLGFGVNVGSLQPSASPIGQDVSTDPQAHSQSAAKTAPKYIICPFGPPIQLRPDGRRRRFHAARDQLVLLEQIFKENKKPNSKERIEICKRVNMNPRSLQIWFQNRRAKEKKEGSGGAIENSSESVDFAGDYVGANGSHGGNQSASPVTPTMPADATTPSTSHPNMPLQNQHISDSNIYQHNVRTSPIPKPATSSNSLILTTSIAIGSWRRLSLTPQDLTCEILTYQGLLRWSVIESGFCFKMELPITAINDMSVHSVPENPTLSSLVLQINMRPSFYRQVTHDAMTNPTSTFVACGDFTEHMQASSVYCHILEGSHAEMERGFTILQNYFNEKYFVAAENNASVPNSLGMHQTSIQPPLQQLNQQLQQQVYTHHQQQGGSVQHSMSTGVGLAINTSRAIQDPKLQQYYYNDSAPLPNAAVFGGFLGGPMSAVGTGSSAIDFAMNEPAIGSELAAKSYSYAAAKDLNVVNAANPQLPLMTQKPLVVASGPAHGNQYQHQSNDTLSLDASNASGKG